jgi:hypothetical protein
MTSRAASPIRASPAANIGFPHKAPPDGFTRVPGASPRAVRRISSWWLNGACSSATCAVPAPAAWPAAAADGAVVRSREPTDAGSIRCSNPEIQAGRAHSARARDPAARITTAAPSPTGAQSCARSGSATYGRPSRSAAGSVPDTWACGLAAAAARLRAATSAISFSLHAPASIPSRACSAAMLTESGHSGASR